MPHAMTLFWQLLAGKALVLGAGRPVGWKEDDKAFTWEKRMLNLSYKHERYGKRHTYRVWGQHTHTRAMVATKRHAMRKTHSGRQTTDVTRTPELEPQAQAQGCTTSSACTLLLGP
jgi:hypothetical protein